MILQSTASVREPDRALGSARRGWLATAHLDSPSLDVLGTALSLSKGREHELRSDERRRDAMFIFRGHLADYNLFRIPGGPNGPPANRLAIGGGSGGVRRHRVRVPRFARTPQEGGDRGYAATATIVKRLLLIPAAALIAFGAEGLYHAFRGRDKIAIDCLDLTRQPPPSHRLLVTGCEIDFAGSGFRESGGQIQELFLPARPAGRSVAAPLVIATREPGAIAMAQSALGGGRMVAPEQSIAVMQNVAVRIKAVGPIDGLARAGFIERFRSRRILSGLASPIAADAALIDLGGTPDHWTPLLALGAGLLLGILAFDVRGRGAAPAVAIAPSPSPAPASPALASPPAAAPAIALPRLLLLNLEFDDGPDSIERAPALGSRRDVIAMLCGAVPDLTVDDARRILSRPDSIRIDLGAQDPVATAVVDARGEAGAALVKEVLLMTGWRAFAPKTGLFVSIDDLTALEKLARIE